MKVQVKLIAAYLFRVQYLSMRWEQHKFALGTCAEATQTEPQVKPSHRLAPTVRPAHYL